MKFLALVVALFVVLFLVAQLIHAVDRRSHQTTSSTEQPHTRLAATSVSSSGRVHELPISSSTSLPATSTSGNNARFLAAAPAAHPGVSSTGSITPSGPVTVSLDSAFTTLAFRAEPSSDKGIERANDGFAANSSEAATDTERYEPQESEVEGADERPTVQDDSLTYSAFTPASAPSRPLCRALVGKVSYHIEHGAEDGDDASDDQQADSHDLRLSVRLEHVEAMVDQVDMHVKLSPEEHRTCYHSSSTHQAHYHYQSHYQPVQLDYDSADERHGLTSAELTYRMVAHPHVGRRGEQHWDKLINFLAQTRSQCAQVALTLHQRALACTTEYRPLRLPSAEWEGGEKGDEAVTGWEASAEEVRHASHAIVSLLDSLASLVSSAAIGLTPAPVTTSPARVREVSPPPSAASTPASLCRNISFTATARLVSPTRVHLLYTPHYHHPSISKVEAILRNIRGPLVSLRPYRMSRVRHTHMPVYRAVARMGLATAGRGVLFDYSFRVTLKSGHVTCTVPGGHFSSNSSISSAGQQPSQSSSHPPAVAERCPISDVFNASATIVRSSAVQASSESAQHSYKLVLTSHTLQLDWVHVHLFLNSSVPDALTEGRYRMTRALTAPNSAQQPSGIGKRWERELDSVADAQAEVEYAFTYHFNGSSCDTTARVSSLERLLMGEESVGPAEQIRSLFHVLDAGEDEQLKAEQDDRVDELMDDAQQEDGLQVVAAGRPMTRENQAPASDRVDEQMETSADAAATVNPDTHEPPQVVSVGIDALGRVVPASVPFDVTQHAGIGPVLPPPYHQYHQPQHVYSAASMDSAAAPVAHPPSSTASHSTAPQHVEAYNDRTRGGEERVWGVGGCMSDDYMCQITAMCRPCMDRSHADFCAPCAHLFQCQTEQCARAAVRLIATRTCRTASLGR